MVTMHFLVAPGYSHLVAARKDQGQGNIGIPVTVEVKPAKLSVTVDFQFTPLLLKIIQSNTSLAQAQCVINFLVLVIALVLVIIAKRSDVIVSAMAESEI